MTASSEHVNGFNDKKAYQAQEEEGQKFFDDGREIDLLHFIFNRPDIASIRDSPQKVLDAIDEYGRTKKYLMNVGDQKGKIVCDLIRDLKPRLMVELGSYIGYSAILFGATVRDAGGSQYFSIERNPEFAAVTMALVDLAGLNNIVKVIIGPSAECIKRLHADASLGDKIDMMFLDHYKPAYTTDVKLCESLGLIGPGTVLAADNVIKPGNPPYLEYVRSSVEEKRKKLDQGVSKATETASFDKRWRNQYEERVGEEKLDAEQLGNPNLVYKSRLIHSFEPTGVPDGIEITECLA
ncbi:MAG: hypothetical protein LQ351_008013 [Letrouitia transgressa]|nr:MAG: hypothetical protein LQ351_008013 [Letrouitia transgressa]